MPTDDEVRAARARNDALREEIAELQTQNRIAAEEANAEYRLLRLDRDHEDLERQLATLQAQVPAAIPQEADPNAVYADTVQSDAQPEVSANDPAARVTRQAGRDDIPEPPRPVPATNVPSTPTDVATINPQGE